MAQVSLFPAHDDLPLGSAGRAVAGLVAALTLHGLNRVLSQPGLAVATDPTKVQCNNEFIYSLTGQILRADFAGADNFLLTGLTPVPQGHFQRYFFLVDRDENPRVQEAVSNPIATKAVLSNLSPNPFAATVMLLNAGNGWTCIGGLGIHVKEDAAAAFVPGVDPLTIGATLDALDFIDGFDGGTLLPCVSTTAQQVLV